ncbi:aspartate/glutamate racemase family protein [Paucibacter sp. PLA-PC-4]|uniref:aspartate/glutamate racemase family protein n=1 Tax=Paucibacter sp. PLA-PC-4 TaxID=2993655 RepID=UPI002249516E|nr:aspartate/glutamate racemase family protein [Paucibacter sp. PLA-PC-4]MCX2860435.1 aspartate/glutamate racemase family protein [Paucibacter sp. PLA-PC-4]
MRTLGILGGMSWESSAHLYKLLNQGMAARQGGLHSARLILHSVDFAEIEALQRSADWADAATLLGRAGAGLKAAGAEGLLIATNTMHKVADEIEALSGLPLIHIVDGTAAALRAVGVERAGLLATAYTMEQDFYRGRMARHGIELLTPDASGRAEVHRIIYEELCLGRIVDASRRFYEQQVAALAAAGAQAVILGCTEVCLLLDPVTASTPVPLFDSTSLHAQAALDWMLAAPQSKPPVGDLNL